MEISKFNNWFKEFGWRHLVALIFVVFAIYPILYVLTNSFADFANLTNSKLIPDSLTLKHYKLLSGNPLVPYSDWLFNNSFGIADAATLPYIIRMEQLALGELFSSTKRPNINNWYERIKNMDIFENAVTSFIPEALIGVLTKFGNDQKDRVFKIMENK